MCFHIRISPDLRSFAAPRSFSQLVTSFIGSWCQGIPLALLLAWPSSKKTSLRFLLLSETSSRLLRYYSWSPIIGSLELCRLNRSCLTKLYLPLIKKFPHLLSLSAMYIPVHHALCCLAFHTCLLCSVFKVQNSLFRLLKDTLCTLKIEQCKNLKRSDLGMLHETCDLVRSP